MDENEQGGKYREPPVMRTGWAEERRERQRGDEWGLVAARTKCSGRVPITFIIFRHRGSVPICAAQDTAVCKARGWLRIDSYLAVSFTVSSSLSFFLFKCVSLLVHLKRIIIKSTLMLILTCTV